MHEGAGACKKAAHELATSIVQLALSAGAFNIDIPSMARWQSMWPRPQSVSGVFAETVSVTVASDGHVDFSPMYQRANNAIFEQWSDMIRAKVGDGAVQLAAAMRACSGFADFVPLLAQLACGLALRAEHCLLTMAKDRSKRILGMSHARLRPCTENIASSSDLGSKLARCVLGCVAESEKHHIYGCAVDKSTPCKQSLHNGVILFPSGVAAIMAPQVTRT